MNTKALIGLVAVIVIAGGAYLLWGGGALNGTGGYGPTTTVSIAGRSSLQSLVAAGNPVVCTFSTTTSNGSQSGTIYVANGMVAGDFTATDSHVSDNVNAHMIIRDNTSYVWTNASNQGFKSTVNASSTGSANQGVDYNAQLEYSCQAWKPDTSKFNLPTAISFISTASYRQPSQGTGVTGASTGVTGTAAQCAQCDSLPSAQKAQCLAALSCQ
jgi:hypothetical protein